MRWRGSIFIGETFFNEGSGTEARCYNERRPETEDDIVGGEDYGWDYVFHWVILLGMRSSGLHFVCRIYAQRAGVQLLISAPWTQDSLIQPT